MICIKLILLFIFNCCYEQLVENKFSVFHFFQSFVLLSDETMKAVCFVGQFLPTFWFPFSNSKSPGQLYENLQMNHDCILRTPKNICAHLKFSKICLILIWGLSLFISVVFVCINVSRCAIEVDLQWEAVGNETHCPHCPCCEGLLWRSLSLDAH